MAVLLWMSSGIRLKMDHDTTTATAFRQYFKDAIWTMDKTIRDNDPLTIDMILPSIFLLSLGLVLSIIAFFVEVFNNLYEKRKEEMQVGKNALTNMTTIKNIS